ncbi:heterokaryon incompatibility protein-domain-containing protein [Exophiala viscosa]|uniref:Heterokaryon incompatibility protein-domain-containing protein n=1 Tax=Exophiala viscosa TaxID=2486360 RepID=A0AAN6DUS4_9EURO|nr:heterokaryon incompatibility protein-domain-containing protein [Exophiala viscosa]
MLATSNAYVYDPLQSTTSVRLIRLVGRSQGSLIDCVLEQFDLQSAPCYRALSYYWESAVLARQIFLEGSHHFLHDSLWQFLDQMVSHGDLGYYWTDALCIDQFNVHERNHQVGYMGEIYEQADEVIIWLGREKRTEAAMWLLSRIARYEVETLRNEVDHGVQGFIKFLYDDEVIKYMLPYLRHSDDQSNCRDSLVEYPPRVLETRLLEATTDLLMLPYWQRLWVVQEVALARAATPVCGAFSISIEYFEKHLRNNMASSMLSHPLSARQRTSARTGPVTATLLRLIFLRQIGGRKPLWKLLDEFCMGQCTEPRDKVYSLLGLVQGDNNTYHIRNSIRVDYGKPVQDIVWDALFECDAPDTRMGIIMHRLASSLSMDLRAVFAWLAAYETRISTDQVHSQYSAVAMHVAKEVKAAALATGVLDICGNTYVKSPESTFTSHKTLATRPKLKNAIKVGLALARMSGLPWKTILSEYRSPWLCRASRVSIWTSDHTCSTLCRTCHDKQSELLRTGHWSNLFRLHYKLPALGTPDTMRTLYFFVDDGLGVRDQQEISTHRVILG